MKRKAQCEKLGFLRRGTVLLACLCGMALSTLGAPVGAQSVPLAGTQIGNQATATYTDSSGISRSATSNIVYTVIQQVASLTLTADNTKYATAGSPVVFPHVVTNTGNGDDSFALSVTQSAADNFDLTGVVFYADANGDGIADNATAITTTPPLEAGQSYSFVVVGTVPGSAAALQSAQITVTATSVFDGGQSASNTDTVNVTSNAVINVTKSITPTTSGSADGTTQYTVTLTYTNSGNTAALNHVLTDVLSPGFTYVAGSGRWSVTGATALTDAAGGDPGGPSPTIDYQYGGATRTVTAAISTVGAGVSQSVSFKVVVTSGYAAGAIQNRATYTYDDGSGTTISGTTNTVDFTITPTAAVSITGDTVAGAAQSSTVTFNNIVTNNGNQTDTFDITVHNSLFPTGTSFVVFRPDGVTQLLDTDSDGVVDTGPLAAGASLTVVLKAVLPPGVSGVGPYTVQKTATSSLDTNVSATATDTLNAITAASVDLTNNVSIAGGATAADGLGQGPEANAVVSLTVNPGSTVRFDLYVNNTSAVADSYLLQASTDPTFAVTSFPPGVTVVFKDAGGTVITNTGIILPNENKHVFADITFPPTAPAGPYNGYFRAISGTTGAFDIKHDEVVIRQVRSINVTPDNAGQVFPGGAVVYTHTISNNGNVTEGDGTASTVTLSVTHTAAGFTSAIYYDANADGVLDASDPIVTDISSFGGLTAGVSKTLFVKVYAPAGAVAGTVDQAVLTATATQGSYSTAAPPPESATNTTTVISGQLSLTKAQALDAACDGTADTAYSVNQITTGAVPGACVRYRVTITNTGTADATSVVVTDATPPYTVYDNGDGTTTATGVAVFTKDGGATFTACTAPADGSTGTITANIGTLQAGGSAVVYFGLKIVPLP